MRLEKAGPEVKTFLKLNEFEKMNWEFKSPTAGGRPPIPTVASTVPAGGRRFMVGYGKSYNSRRDVIKGFVLSCGSQSGTPTDTLFRAAIMSADGYWYTGGAETGLPKTVIGGLKQDTPQTWQSGRTTGMGAAASRLMRFPFDTPTVLEAGTPYYFVIMAELGYTTDDSAWSNNWLHHDSVQMPNTEAVTTSGDTGRPLYYNTLGAEDGIATALWSTYENPTTTTLATAAQSATGLSVNPGPITIANLGTLHSLAFWLECQV